VSEKYQTHNYIANTLSMHNVSCPQPQRNCLITPPQFLLQQTENGRHDMSLPLHQPLCQSEFTTFCFLDQAVSMLCDNNPSRNQEPLTTGTGVHGCEDPDALVNVAVAPRAPHTGPALHRTIWRHMCFPSQRYTCHCGPYMPQQ
jgi:hypothetical protein